MDPINLKNTLKQGGKVYGTMLWGIDSARLTSFLDSEFLDYAIIEAEHAPRTLYQINSMTTALRSKNITSIVRITSPNPEIAGATIDAGADGILVPYCEDIEELKLSFGRTYFNPLKGKYLKKVLQKYNKDTDEQFDEFMSWSERENYLKDNPHIEPMLTTAALVGDHIVNRMDGGMKETFSRIAEAHPNSPLADRFGTGRGGKSRKVENVGKKHGLIRKDGSQNVSKLGSKVSNYK